MDRRRLGRASLGVFAAMLSGAAKAATQTMQTTHKMALQVNSEDRRIQTGALGNARNFAAYYRAKGEACAIEIVVFGAGYGMVRADMSMMKGELETLQAMLGAILTVSACRNTRATLAEAEGKAPGDIPLLPGVRETPSGVVRLVELQEEGWAYIKA